MRSRVVSAFGCVCTHKEKLYPLFAPIKKIFGSFPFVPPQYVMLLPVTEHVSLHSKSLCKNIARASGGCK